VEEKAAAATEVATVEVETAEATEVETVEEKAAEATEVATVEVETAEATEVETVEEKAAEATGVMAERAALAVGKVAEATAAAATAAVARVVARAVAVRGIVRTWHGNLSPLGNIDCTRWGKLRNRCTAHMCHHYYRPSRCRDCRRTSW